VRDSPGAATLFAAIAFSYFIYRTTPVTGSAQFFGGQVESFLYEQLIHVA